MGTVAQSSSVLILVHDHIQSPLEPVFHAPMLANNGVETLRRQSFAEQVVGHFGSCFLWRLANSNHFADRPQARPLVLFLEPIDIRGNRCRAGLDSSVVGLDDGRGHGDLAVWIVQKQDHIVMQRALVTLQRQRVVTFLLYDLLRDRTLAVERVGGHDGALQRKQLQQLRHRGDLVGLGVGGYLRQHHALLAAPGTDHVQGRLATGPIERAAQDLPIDGHNALALLRKLSHEPLKRLAEPLRVQIAKQPAERVVAGQAIVQCTALVIGCSSVLIACH